jgi:hypothetical protein
MIPDFPEEKIENEAASCQGEQKAKLYRANGAAFIGWGGR